MKIITKNKKAFFDYQVLHKIEAGIALTGNEVKSLRAGHVNLTGSFATFKGSELFLVNANISVYSHAAEKDESATSRSRKLLLHKKELMKLIGQISQKGLTLVPLMLYFSPKGLVKVEIGLCKHKKAQGKKQALKERDIKRDTDRELKNLKK